MGWFRSIRKAATFLAKFEAEINELRMKVDRILAILEGRQ